MRRGRRGEEGGMGTSERDRQIDDLHLTPPGGRAEWERDTPNLYLSLSLARALCMGVGKSALRKTE